MNKHMNGRGEVVG